MVHLKNPVSIKKYFGSVCEKYWLPSTNCQKTKINCLTAKSMVLEWESNTFATRSRGSNPKRLLNKTVW